jgi:hypothetical protein
MVNIPRQANVTEIRKELMDKYGYTYDDVNDVLFYTADNKKSTGRDSEWKTPDAEGFITVRYYGLSRFTIEDFREFTGKRLAKHPDLSYNREGKGLPIRERIEKGTRHMPPAKGRRAATAPPPPAEPEANGQVDFQKYISKDLSPTMADYVEWFEQEVASLDDIPVDKILVLGVSLYGHFQKSDFNIDRREARRANRAPAPEPEPEPAKPARGGRGRSRAAAPEPEPETEPEPAARRGRGRPSRAGTRAGAEAPY